MNRRRTDRTPERQAGGGPVVVALAGLVLLAVLHVLAWLV